MKKIILALSITALAISCKKLPEGGNKGVLKLEEGVERYTDDVQSSGNTDHTAHSHHSEIIDVEINGLHLKGKKDGFEAQLAKYLLSGAYASAEESTLKTQWYDFDNVNFKLGSANELENGAEQIQNLAEILKKYPEVKIKIGGYTDKTGDDKANKELSQKRADFIKSELSKLGVTSQVISAEGYGSEFATVAADAPDTERAKDRKMSVRLTK